MRRFVKWTALVTGILFLLFVVGSLVFRVEIAEYTYKRDPTDANLVNLAVTIVRYQDYKRMTQYLPPAAELDNFTELSEQNGWYVRGWSDKNDAVNYTYMAVVSRAALSFIYADEYDEFCKIFPKMVDKMLDFEYRSIMGYAWLEALREKAISQTGYNHIIQALEDYPPPFNPEEGLKDHKEISAGASLVNLKVFVYWEMGDDLSAYRIEAEWDQILKDYIKKNQKNTDTP